MASNVNEAVIKPTTEKVADSEFWGAVGDSLQGVSSKAYKATREGVRNLQALVTDGDGRGRRGSRPQQGRRGGSREEEEEEEEEETGDGWGGAGWDEPSNKDKEVHSRSSRSSRGGSSSNSPKAAASDGWDEW